MAIPSNRLSRGVAALLLFTICTHAHQAPTTLRGTWTAAANATQVLHGTWSAQLLPDSPNQSSGSWALLDEANRIVLQGTWSASKSQRSWNGTWAARIVPPGATPGGRDAGKVVSGTFRADLNDSDAKSFEEMLRRTLQEQVVGVWRSGRSQGRWSLRGWK